MNDFPSGAYRARVRDGITQWNQLNQTFQFGTEQGDVAAWSSSLLPCDSWAFRNGVGFHGIDGFGLVRAVTTRCFNNAGPHSGEMKKFAVEFDSAESWYTGTGDATGSHADLWSAATHELGHATGWGNPFNGGLTLCADDSSQHTMCPIYYVATERMRTLESHDVHTFSAVY